MSFDSHYHESPTQLEIQAALALEGLQCEMIFSRWLFGLDTDLNALLVEPTAMANAPQANNRNSERHFEGLRLRKSVSLRATNLPMERVSDTGPLLAVFLGVSKSCPPLSMANLHWQPRS